MIMPKFTCFDEDGDQLEVTPEDGVMDWIDAAASQSLVLLDDRFHRFHVVPLNRLWRAERGEK